MGAVSFATSGTRAAALPSMVKIDTTPLCALACPTCVHADPAGRDKPLLAARSFDSQARMDVAHFTQLVQRIKGRALAATGCTTRRR